MMNPEPGWELYRTFLAVVREGSLSGAARALGLTQPTAGRHVDALERALGFALFVRTQQGLSPTEAALALRPYAESLESTSAALLRAASSQREGVRGTVRITASEVVTVEVLPVILADLHAAYPGLIIELVPSNRLENLLRRDADIAVRMQRPSQGVLIARHLGGIELGVHAHRRYLERRGTPATLDDLAGHALIGYDRETAFIRGMKGQVPWMRRDRFALRTDSDLAGLAALRAGFGIGICQVGLARRDPDLVRLFADDVAPVLDTWLAMHEDLRDSPRCRVVFDALAAGLVRYVNGD
ncbi:LysR family transcriptional regulator [Ralstonia solanacearum]|uniref:LysR family transcriptional regulator n=1 Tax=Ralstonia solanacearum TaxID=305 RepID=UPI00078E6C0D|nr:LysR family transcriptional regulator [Ralstonia solanacearum]AMP36111.1 LysR family transcriptional regulator [Ralstonia solanacearum]AXV84905.1 LysR family transcriptional regulator [Ralstonia solanacearum]AXW04455.1 LysR family transcriptional regulator [Ralstonia solanacearum]AXW22207.1 LysR family transcriptional regulator [Ralstonia solanacearum]AXW79104.1 LysR family transcriptional regulator [Ralstonia solanacearum]